MAILESLVVKTLIYATVVLSFSFFIVQGLGLWPVGHLAMFGMGALIYGMVTTGVTTAGINTYAAMLLGASCASLLAVLPALASIRVKGTYFVFVSIVLGEVVRVLVEVVSGPGGYSFLPRPLGLNQPAFALAFAAIMYLFVVYLCYRFSGHRLYTLINMVKTSESAAMLLGVPIQLLKLKIFLLSGAIAGFAGAFFAAYTGSTDPRRFSVSEGVVIFGLALLVGRDYRFGPLVAAGLYVILDFTLDTVLRDFLPRNASNAATLIFGILILFAAANVRQRFDELE
jgi:branched-chain amino acid transport system permease protein